MAKCGAKKRNGEKCKSPAMPNGKCRLHGGATPARNPATTKHGFYAKGYTEEEKVSVEALKVGSLEAELAAARITLQRAFAVPEFVEGSTTERNEHYRPDIIERQLMLIGRLEKQHAEITAQIPEDAHEQAPVAVTIEVVDGRKPSS